MDNFIFGDKVISKEYGAAYFIARVAGTESCQIAAKVKAKNNKGTEYDKSVNPIVALSSITLVKGGN